MLPWMAWDVLAEPNPFKIWIAMMLCFGNPVQTVFWVKYFDDTKGSD